MSPIAWSCSQDNLSCHGFPEMSGLGEHEVSPAIIQTLVKAFSAVPFEAKAP